MKRNILYMLAASCIMTASCSKAVPDGFRVDEPESYSKIYIGNAFHGSIDMTLLPEQDTVLKVYANYGGLLGLDAPVMVTFEARPDLVQQYNETMRTAYQPLPMTCYVFEHRAVTISSGKDVSDAMLLHISSEGLTGKGPYMLPVGIASVIGSDIPVNPDLQTLYVMVNYDDSSVEYPYYDREGWKVVSESSYDGDSVPEAVLDGDRQTRWTCSQEHEHVLTVDMMRPLLTHGVSFTSAIRLIHGDEYHYAGQPRTITVELSQDNENWRTAAEQIRVPFGIDSEIRFGDYIKSRYIRLTVSETWITKNVVGNTLSFSEFKVF